MKKSELLDTIREKNKELDSLNKELNEILNKENSKNLGKCFKQNLYGSYTYYKIIQVCSEYNTYKVLCICDSEINVHYQSIQDLEPCSSKEFDNVYNTTINNTLANKVISFKI